MAFTIEVEEWVGSVWHRFITRRASPDFPEARVELESMQRPLSLLFRAMGGASGVGVEAASARDMLVRRNLLQQVAGTCKQLPVAWCDASNLRLPQSLAVYPDVSLNGTCIAGWRCSPRRRADAPLGAGQPALDPGHPRKQFPAMRARYRRPVEAHLQLRPDPSQLPKAEAALESALCQALREPGSVSQFPRSERAPGHCRCGCIRRTTSVNPRPRSAPRKARAIWKPRPVASRASASGLGGSRKARARGGLLLFRLENLFSWSEHIELDRCGDDTEDLDAARVAEDLDELALSRQRMRQGGGLKLDLDLPAADFDDVPLGEGIKLPEWDYRKQCLQKDFVNLQLMLPRGAEAKPLPLHLSPRAALAPAVRASAQRPPVAASATPWFRAGHAGLARFSRRAAERPVRRARPVHGTTAESP